MDVAVLLAPSTDSMRRLYVVLAVKPMRLNKCERDGVVFCMYSVRGVLVPYHNFPVASSFVFHETVADVVATEETLSPEMIGVIISGVDVAVVSPITFCNLFAMLEGNFTQSSPR